jgi:hypothetical protein
MSSDGPLQQTPLGRLEAIIAMSDAALAAGADAIADELIAIGEATLESWLLAKGATPTVAKVEGFRLLALHRQGSRGDPSFNACRETCRELVYHCNCIRVRPGAADAARLVRLGAMVARHLVLFVQGKLEVAGLGEFCCSSRPLRLREAALPVENV